jgi:hypothetical protein
MNPKLKNTKLLLIALSLTLLIAGFASAQGNPEKLRSGVDVKGEIGGEGHATYFIRARKDQTINVLITPRGKKGYLVAKGGNFNLSVTRGSLDGREVIGRESGGRKRRVWTGRAKATSNYYFDITAHSPDGENALYTLRVTIK